MSERDPLIAAISVDDDKTYPHRRIIAEGGTRDFAYPYAIQTKPWRESLSNHSIFIDFLLFSPHDAHEVSKSPLQLIEAIAFTVSVKRPFRALDDAQDVAPKVI